MIVNAWDYEFDQVLAQAARTSLRRPLETFWVKRETYKSFSEQIAPGNLNKAELVMVPLRKCWRFWRQRPCRMRANIAMLAGLPADAKRLPTFKD